MKKEIEILDHTGDIGIRIHAPSLEELFRLAAKGMFQIMLFHPAEKQETEFQVTLQANDLEQLMVNWLSELNFLFQTEQFVLADVAEIAIDNNSLMATVSGELFEPDKHQLHTEIKAVTFHKIYVKQEKSGWTAQLIFDI